MPGRSLRPALGWFATGAAVVAAFLLLGVISHAVSPSPSGPALSSYATTPRGVAAWAELLNRDGHSVNELRTPVGEHRLPARATLIILSGSGPAKTTAAALQQFLDRGGRLVLGGHAAALAPALHGDLSALAHPTFLENGALANSDNAYRALALAGAPARPVYFDEAVHGYGPASGLAALPARWWFAIVAFALALAAWALFRAARLGGRDPIGASRPSPRAAYIEAMAETLVRAAGRPELEQRLATERDRESTWAGGLRR